MTKIRFQYSTKNNDVYFFSFLNDKLTSFYLHSTGTPIKYTADINQYMHQLESLTSLHEGGKSF